MLDVVFIKMYRVVVDGAHHILTFVDDLTEVQALGLNTMQKSFQQTFTNALTHERMTPLNSILNCSHSIIKKQADSLNLLA